MSAEPTTEVAVRDPLPAVPVPSVMTNDEIDQTFRVAKALAMSGLFKDSRQAEIAFAKILVGRDLGLSPTQALVNIHIIEGKPELSANLQAAFVRRTPGYDYRVAKHTDEECEIVFLRDGEELGRSRFTIDDARKAGLAGKGVWKSYPRNMLFARAMSNGVAFHCPEVTGGVRVYHEGEIGNRTVDHVEPGDDVEFDFGDDELGERLRELVDRINEAKPGTWRPAKLRMLLARATDEERKAFVDMLEGQLAELTPPEAEVIAEAA